MKKILVIGGGAMGSAFTIPCLENNNSVTITEPYSKVFIKNLSSKKKFHSALRINLPKKLRFRKFSKDLLREKFDLIVIALSLSGIDFIGNQLRNLNIKTPILVLTKGLKYEKKTKRILNKEVSKKINPILRKIVSTKEGTAGFANVKGYDIGGKTGTADIAAEGGYSKKKINTFASVFPISNPKFVLVVMLDEPKANKEFVYHYRDGRNPYKGNWRNTAGWTTVWTTGQIIEKIGPILATKY